ncbi:MAG: hypothetical protein DRG30_01280, partial [Epsilonproteobacteria bacterium]
MLLKDHSFRLLFMGTIFLFFFSLILSASVSLNDYPQIKSNWDDGELTIAINKLQEEAKKRSQNDDMVDLLKKLTFQKNKFDQWLSKANNLLRQQKFKEATEVISFIKSINPNYIRYIELMNRIKTAEEELKYPFNVLFDGKSMGDRWKPYDDFEEYIKFDNSTLMIDVPKSHGWAQVGLESSETIINFTESNQSYAYHLKFKLDPKNTTGFAINLEGENLDKKLRSFSKISIVYKVINEKSAILELRKDEYLQAKLEMSTVPESMELIIQPNNFMYLYLEDGRYLQTTSIKYSMPTKGYKLKIYSQAKAYQTEAKLALKSLALQKIPFEKKKLKAVIFDGKHLEDMWKPYEAHNHHFSEYTRFDNSALVVNVPKKRGWAQVGIESSETIINFTESNQSYAYRLKFKFDPNDTRGFGIELEGRNIDKSCSINKLQVFYKKIDDNASVLELRKDYGALHTKLEMGSVTPGDMELLIQPNNMMYLYLLDGRYLQTTSAEYTMPTKGYTLKVYSKPIKRELPSKMSLKSIELKREPFEKRVDPSNLGKKEGKIVLFDGKYLGNGWIPYNEQYKNYFKEYARFDKNGFMIDIPKKHKWGEAGIITPEPIVWLDGLGRDGEYKAIFNFDPIRTTGFTIGAGSYNSSWKEPARPSASLNWSQIADQNTSKLKIYIDFKLILEENLTAVSPSIITLGFEDGTVTFDGDTFDTKTFKWSYIIENRPLHLWAFSRAYKKNLPAKMALGKVILERKIATPTSPPKPAPGVEPLPGKEIFGSKNFEDWKCYKFSTDKKDHNCTIDLSDLTINIKRGVKSLYAIKSKNKIITLDSRRIEVTPLKIVFSFDPRKTDSFDIAINSFYKYHVALQKIGKNKYIFKWNDKLERTVDEKWLKNEWNGKVNIVVAKKWIRIELDNGVKIPVPLSV